ncbi:hypothetical protein ACQ4LE_005301 [Meloidogyne hapla]
MTKISFYSAIGNRIKSVKVSLQKPINAGVQAQVYHGCYYESKSKSDICVAVKLLGIETQQSEKRNVAENQKEILKSLGKKDAYREKIFKELKEKNLEQEEQNKSKVLKGIFEDSLNEISVLKLFQEKLANKRPDHIIYMYDGGPIVKIHDTEKEQAFDYAIILELGNETFRNKILSIASTYVEKDEEIINYVKRDEEIINILSEAAEVLKQIHEVVIHMDLKPTNLLYVSDSNSKGKEERLKAIDFSGSILLNGQRPSLWNDKISVNSKINNLKYERTYSHPSNVEGNINLKKSQTNNKTQIGVEKIFATRQYLPPELDTNFLIEHANDTDMKNASVSTKADVWMFGMICYELLLYVKYYSTMDTVEIHTKVFNFFN